MKKILLLNFLMLVAAAINAQTIQGSVLDGEGKNVGNATVSLLKLKDSSIAKLSVTNENGEYQFKEIQPGKYFAKVSFVGYDNATSGTIDYSSSDAIIPPIVIMKSSSELKGVTVAARKPMIEVKADKTILNVENTINSVGNDALELLRKSPGVLVDKDDNISLSGKNGVKIYIDGKPSPLSGSDLSNYLKSLQSAQIEAIEIINNPGAKYEAEGNAGIINIRLKKNKTFGTNGSVSAGFNTGEFQRYNGSANLNHRSGKINVFGSYNYSDNRNGNYMNMYRVQLDTVFNQRTDMDMHYKGSGFKAGIDYYLNKNNTIGIMANGNYSTFDMNSTTNTPFGYKGSVDRILAASNHNVSKRNSTNFNANYRYTDTSGRELNIDADYGIYDLKSNQLQPNYYYDPATGAVINQYVYNMIAPSTIDIYSAKADYEQNFKKGKLGLGAKSSYVTTNNDFERYNVYPNQKVMDTLKSNNFNYKENINAVYANYNRQFKGFMIQAGLRVENTYSKGISNGYRWNSGAYETYDSSFTKKYTDLFPSAAITFNKNPMNQWSLSYSRRIDRPAYQDLNPFEFKLDEYTYMKGNTELQPQYTNSIALTNTFKYKLTTTLTYSHVNDVFSQIIDTTDRSKAFMTKKNLADQDIVSLNISYPFSYKWYSVFANVNSYYTHYKADFGAGRKINLDAFAVNLYAQQSIKLGKTTTFEMSGFYASPSVWQGTFKSKAMWSLDAGLQQSLLKGKATVKASVTDIFKTMKWGGTSDFAGQYIKMDGGWDSRQFKLNLTYRFGNSQVKADRQRKTAADEESKRVGGQSAGGIGGGGK